mmetsp:Transcript_22465/g.47991  ORF Transcript_22465/g.47991 Transcript_22465/m.47991 type:complete len:262 (-) Transcript_22465:304-1089(-)
MADFRDSYFGSQARKAQTVRGCRLLLEGLVGLPCRLGRRAYGVLSNLQEGAKARFDSLAEERSGVVTGEDVERLGDPVELLHTQALPLLPLAALRLARCLCSVEECDIRFQLLLGVVVGLRSLCQHNLCLCLLGRLLLQRLLDKDKGRLLLCHEILIGTVPAGLISSSGLEICAEGPVHLLEDALNCGRLGRIGPLALLLCHLHGILAQQCQVRGRRRCTRRRSSGCNRLHPPSNLLFQKGDGALPTQSLALAMALDEGGR